MGEFRGEWPSGLRHWDRIGKFPIQTSLGTPQRHSVEFRDPTSLHGGCPLDNYLKLAVWQSNNR